MCKSTTKAPSRWARAFSKGAAPEAGKAGWQQDRCWVAKGTCWFRKLGRFRQALERCAELNTALPAKRGLGAEKDAQTAAPATLQWRHACAERSQRAFGEVHGVHDAQERA